MDLSHPLSTVSPTLDAAVLQALSATTGLSTGAQVHRMARTGSPDGVRRVLSRLVRQGVVLTEQHGGTGLYQLNRDHLAVDPILALTRLRARIIDNITAAIHEWSVPPTHASLFGSFARGEADEASDIDILLVRENEDVETMEEPAEAWHSQVDQLALDIQRWTGNNAHAVEITLRRLAAMVETNDPLVDSWRADHVHLNGQRLLDLLRSNRFRT